MKPTKLYLTLIGCGSLITLLAGCGSLICGPKQTVNINSKPDGAEVLVYDSYGDIVFRNTTPCVATLDRNTKDYGSATYVVLVRKEGFAPVQVSLEGRVNKAYFANILFGGVGLIIDPITGGMWTLSPDKVEPKLVGENEAFFNRKGGLLICLKEQVPQDLWPYLEPVQD